jgi:hypothetical protein
MIELAQLVTTLSILAVQAVGFVNVGGLGTVLLDNFQESAKKMAFCTDNKYVFA